MATVKIAKFGGVAPMLHPSLLADGMATEAHNCRLKSGKLVPLREPEFVDAALHTVYHENGLMAIADAHSVHCWKHTLANGDVRTDFLAFPGRVYFAQGNIADDRHDRLFLTGQTGMDFALTNGETKHNCPCCYLFDRERGEMVRHCICKEPMERPRVSYLETVDENDVDTVAESFFFSWYDEYGYESPASLPSLVKVTEGSNVTYVPGDLTYRSGGTVHFEPVFVPPLARGVRLYKTKGEGSDELPAIQFVKEWDETRLNELTMAFSVDMGAETIGESMPEIEAPPYDLTDMSFVPGSFYAGRMPSMPHTVAFSDVDNPTNWPWAYRYDVRDNVVKLAVTANTVFALTDGTPFALSGTAPESMTVSSLASPAACVSEKSVTVFRNAVHYASNDGLCRIYDSANSGTSVTNMTAGLLSKEQWQALNPKSCVMGAFDGALHMFFEAADAANGGTYEDGSRYKALILDLADGQLTTHDEISTCLCTDDTTDDLYFVRRVAGA